MARLTPVETAELVEPVEEVPARAIWHSIATLFLASENQQRFHGAAERLGVTPGVLKALLELEPDRPRPMRDLVSQWRCDASLVTVLVDGLEGRGLAERQVSPHDRRVKMVVLTPAGVAARELALGEIAKPRPGLDALTRTEQRQLARLLVKLVVAQAAVDAAGATSSAGSADADAAAIADAVG